MRSAHVVISIARNSRREKIPALITNDHSKREKEEPVATKNIEMINSERIPMNGNMDGILARNWAVNFRKAD